jgi:hypothetical protein
VSGKHAVNDRSSMILEIVDFTTAVQMSLRESNALFPYSVDLLSSEQPRLSQPSPLELFLEDWAA